MGSLVECRCLRRTRKGAKRDHASGKHDVLRPLRGGWIDRDADLRHETIVARAFLLPGVVSNPRLHLLVFILRSQMDGMVTAGLVLGRCITQDELGAQFLRDAGVENVHAVLLLYLEVPAPGLFRNPLQNLLAVRTVLLLSGIPAPS